MGNVEGIDEGTKNREIGRVGGLFGSPVDGRMGRVGVILMIAWHLQRASEKCMGRGRRMPHFGGGGGGGVFLTSIVLFCPPLLFFFYS